MLRHTPESSQSELQVNEIIRFGARAKSAKSSCTYSVAIQAFHLVSLLHYDIGALSKNMLFKISSLADEPVQKYGLQKTVYFFLPLSIFTCCLTLSF